MLTKGVGRVDDHHLIPVEASREGHHCLALIRRARDGARRQRVRFGETRRRAAARHEREARLAGDGGGGGSGLVVDEPDEAADTVGEEGDGTVLRPQDVATRVTVQEDKLTANLQTSQDIINSIHIYVFVYIYIYISKIRGPTAAVTASVIIYIYIYIYMCVCVCACMGVRVRRHRQAYMKEAFLQCDRGKKKFQSFNLRISSIQHIDVGWIPIDDREG